MTTGKQEKAVPMWFTPSRKSLLKQIPGLQPVQPVQPVPKSRDSVGFTIIEMAIVLSVIGVLASLLFPTMRAAHERSRKAACMSNLRSMGAGFGLYASDNAGWLPQHAGEFRYARTTGGGTARYAHTLWSDGELRNHGQLLPYVNAASQYWCPSQTGRFGDIDVSEERNRDLLLKAKAESNSEYLYRKEWFDNYQRYHMGALAGTHFAILADHFWGHKGVMAVNTGHRDGYNVLRLGGNVAYYEHPRLASGKLDPQFSHAPGASGEDEWRVLDTARSRPRALIDRAP